MTPIVSPDAPTSVADESGSRSPLASVIVVGQGNRSSESPRKALRELCTLGVAQPRVPVHELIHAEGHLALQDFIGRLFRLLLRAMPFGEVLHGAPLGDVALDQPRNRRDVRVGWPFCFVTVAVEARLLRQCPRFR